MLNTQNTMSKLKVVWLCYFTNSDIQGQLKPFRKVDEIAPWINNLIPLFEHNNSIELHVISQHEWIPWYRSFKKNGIIYHFVNKGIPLIGRHWPGVFRFDHLTNNYFFNKKVARIVKRINPDIIHLHGAENEFSATITQFYKKFPVFITIQGFVHKSSAQGVVAERRKEKELEIIKMFRHFGVRTDTMAVDVKSINPDAVIHWHQYRMKPIVPYLVEKKYDLVFFARMTKDKGIEDLLRAVAIIKNSKPDISLCAIGGGVTSSFRELAAELGIESNVFWAGFLPTQEELHKLASTAKISVLPTYHDIISGTIIESLFLGIPVVAYNVGSIHEVNMNETIISLIDKFDVEGLARELIILLNDENTLNERSRKGIARVKEMFGIMDEEVRSAILNIYNKII